jgi:hypothetical protein
VTTIPARLTYGPIYKFLRSWEIRHNGDTEPTWRHNRNELTSGYQPRNYARKGA